MGNNKFLRIHLILVNWASNLELASCIFNFHSKVAGFVVPQIFDILTIPERLENTTVSRLSTHLSRIDLGISC